MDIQDLTLREINKIRTMFCDDSVKTKEHPFEIGKNYLIRTVTMTHTGTLKWVGDKELVLENAAWIADTGRFSDSLKDCNKFLEVEPFHKPIIIGRGSIIDATEIDDIITVQK